MTEQGKWFGLDQVKEPGVYWVRLKHRNSHITTVRYSQKGFFYTPGIDTPIRANQQWKFYGPLPEPKR